MELAQKLQILEKSQTDAPNNIQITYDTEAELITIAAETPIQFSVNATGAIEINAGSYLA